MLSYDVLYPHSFVNQNIFYEFLYCCHWYFSHDALDCPGPTVPRHGASRLMCPMSAESGPGPRLSPDRAPPLRLATPGHRSQDLSGSGPGDLENIPDEKWPGDNTLKSLGPMRGRMLTQAANQRKDCSGDKNAPGVPCSCIFNSLDHNSLDI